MSILNEDKIFPGESMKDSKITRREFMKLAGSGAAAVALNSSVTGGLKSAFANEFTPGRSGQKTFVFIFLAGGLTANAYCPYSSEYYQVSPDLHFNPTNSLVLNSTQGLHPSLTYFKSAYDQGNLALINSMSFTGAHNRSHASAQHNLSRLQPNSRSSIDNPKGVLSYLACLTPNQSADVPIQTLSLGTSPLTFGTCEDTRKRVVRVGSLDSLAGTQYRGSLNRTLGINFLRNQMRSLADEPKNIREEAYREALNGFEDMHPSFLQINNTQLPGSALFPATALGNDMRDIAKCIAADVTGTRFYTTTVGGWDLHNRELEFLPTRLGDLNNSIKAFFDALNVLGKADDIVLACISEFTRTFQNDPDPAIAGCDHGGGGHCVVMGNSINGGIKSPAYTNSDITSALAADRRYVNTIHVDTRSAMRQIFDGGGYDISSALEGQDFPEVPLNLYT